MLLRYMYSSNFKATDEISSLGFSPNGRLLAIAAKGGFLHVLQSDTLSVLCTLKDQNLSGSPVVEWVDNASFVCGAESGRLSTFNIDQGEKDLEPVSY